MPSVQGDLSDRDQEAEGAWGGRDGGRAGKDHLEIQISILLAMCIDEPS